MSNEVIAWLKSELAKFEGEAAPAIAIVETDVDTGAKAVAAWVKTQGLADLYAIAKSALLAAATGTPWNAILASVVTAGEAAGIQIAKGAEGVVVSMAQADLIAAGTLASPSAAAAA